MRKIVHKDWVCMILFFFGAMHISLGQTNSQNKKGFPLPFCQKVCKNTNVLTTGWLEDFESFSLQSFYGGHLGKNNNSCVCVENIGAHSINTSVIGNDDEYLTLVTGTDEFIDHLTDDGPMGNPYGNTPGISLQRTNGGNRAIRINDVPEKRNQWGELEEFKVGFFAIDFQSEDITSISLDYATVFEYWDKPDHKHPYFKVSVVDMSPRSCADQEVVTSTCITPDSPDINWETLNRPTPYNQSNPDPYYEDQIRFSHWDTMVIDIPQSYRGSHLQLQIEVGDCDGEVVGGSEISLHAGYAYVDNIEFVADTTPPPPPPPTCPNNRCLNIVEVQSCVDYQAWMNCNDPDIDHIDWYYTIGTHNHVFAGTSTGNPAGQHAQPIYLPAPPSFGTWDNYILTVYAEVVFEDGTVCSEISTTTTLSCSSGGGGPFFRMYPNPVKPNGVMSFEGIDLKEIKSIDILDVKGNFIRSEQPRSKQFGVSGLTSGVYIVHFKMMSGEVRKEKFLIE